MAECPFCEREMSSREEGGPAESCTKDIIVYPDYEFEGQQFSKTWRHAVPLGEGAKGPVNGRCPDCNVAVGGFHHPGCDWEQDPLTGDQLLMMTIEGGGGGELAPRHARLYADPHEQIEPTDIPGITEADDET